MRFARGLVLAAGAGLLSAGAPALLRGAEPGPVVGRILLVRAPAEVIGLAPGAALPARAEGMLRAGDRIRTGRGGHVDFRLEPGILLRVREDSALDLRGAGGQRPGGTVLGLRAGAVLLAVAKGAQGHPLRVETPLVTAAIRGTEFGVAYRGDRAVVGVQTGRVEVFDPLAPAQGVLCTAGTQTTVLAGQPPAPPVPITALWASLLGEIGEIGRRAPALPATPEPVGPPRREY
jgi:ferric-dicitrate binding protein FerR (iron transport regulator)